MKEFVRTTANKLCCSGQDLFIRGVAFLNDSTLWDNTCDVPDLASIEERDYALAALGSINTIRLAVKADYFIDAQGRPKESGFAFLDKQLEYVRKFGLRLLLDMHVPAGGAVQDFGVTEQNRLFWQDQGLQDRFIRTWEAIAERYMTEDLILGFELFNEPAVDPDLYWTLIRRTVAAIRAIDKDHLLAIQADRDGAFRNIDDKNILCVYHFYDPLFFTHQNVVWNPVFAADEPVEYPGYACDHTGAAAYWDGNRIREKIHTVRESAQRYDRPVIIGEFALSTSIDDLSQQRWLKDVLSAIDKEGLSGHIYWRQTIDSDKDLTRKENSNMAVISKGDYFGLVQFEALYGPLRKKLDARQYYQNYPAKADTRSPQQQSR